MMGGVGRAADDKMRRRRYEARDGEDSSREGERTTVGAGVTSAEGDKSRRGRDGGKKGARESESGEGEGEGCGGSR